MPTKVVDGVRMELTQDDLGAIESERTALEIPRAIKKKQSEILAQYKTSIAQLTAGYDDHEIASWPQQAEEAKAKNANPNAEVPLVAALATARQVDTSVMVGLILQKEAIFKPIYGQVLGTKQRRLAALAAIDTQSESALENIQSI